jgi:hypothetical protein
MGERRLVHALFHAHNAAPGAAGAAELRRLVAHRDRMAALLRAGRRPEPLAEPAPYRSSYAARLWALAEAADGSVPAGRAPAHLALVDVDDDEL